MGPSAPALGQRDMTVVHNHGYSFLALTQPDCVFWFAFFRLDRPSSWPQREHYTNDDAEELAQSVASHAVAEGMVFGELWKDKYRGMLIPIEEGLLEHWFHGRIVLAGDCAHKVCSYPKAWKTVLTTSYSGHTQHRPGW